MKKFFLSAICALTLGLMFTACNDDEVVENGKAEEQKVLDGAFLINEGTMGLNNASVTYYDKAKGTVVADSKLSALGDVANDALLAQNKKLYVALSSSQSLAIVQGENLDDINVKQVSLEFQPRYMAEKDGYLYISCYGGNILKFNMNSEKVESTLNLEGGKNLEGVAILGNKLYVCNSYYKDEQGNYNYLDELMSVNLDNFTQGETLKTVLNPNYLAVVSNRLFVLGFGDYYLTPYTLAEMNMETKEAVSIAEATKMCVWGDKILYADSQTDWSNWPDVSSNTTFGAYDTKKNEVISNVFKTMPASVAKESVYFLQANPSNGEIMMGVTDYSNTSTIHLFDVEGHHQNTFDSNGMNTNKAIFLK